MITYVFGDVKDLYLVVFRKWSLSYLANDRFPNCFWLDWIHIFKRSSVCFLRWFWTKERISLASFCCCVVIIFSLLKDVIVIGWVKARSKPLVTSMTKETNFLFFPNRQSACPFVKSVCAFRQSGLQSVCLTSLCLSCLESRSHSSFSFFPQLEPFFRRKLWFLIHENSKKSSLWSYMITQQNTHHGSQNFTGEPELVDIKSW